MATEKLMTVRRNRAFVAECVKIIVEHARKQSPRSSRQVVRQALATRPPGYCMSIDRALAVLGRDGCRVAALAASDKPGAWRDLACQIIESMCGPRRMSFRRALFFNLYYNRPMAYYLNEDYALRLIRPYLRRRSVLQSTRVEI